ncbi:hypothetical protein DSM16313_14940 [Acinetobacter seohaensis]|uniref:hypothetical protein n=1 Tax=Acinetobacter towneri TaxID=202956 RepID=UPI001AA03276|nr:hypothetical protein [Acinetobacter towneri]QTD63156.1 hypothetical protein J4G46_07285 [Acinetobacter towneri]GIT83712.1 hypothetical protein DSM16313_14940 [Acinetobacter seohaensis]
MVSVRVYVLYHPNGGKPSGKTRISVMAESKTESAVEAAIEKAYPKWNFVILEID